MPPLERERSLAEAERIIREFIAGQGWRMRIESCGGDLPATICTLYDADGVAFSNGFGKGEGDASLAGAMYEAVEHFYTSAPPVEGGIALRPCLDLHRDPRYAGLPFLSAFAQDGGRRLACRRYRAFTGEADVDVPLFMTYPLYLDDRLPGDDFDYSSAYRYGSNSGVAIGASPDEAAVHAIGEIVERDAWSLFLVAHYLGDPASFGLLVEPASLPPDVARIHALARARLGRDILLVDITTDLRFPAFFATTDRLEAGETVYPCGFGASLHAAHAANRALAELVQCVDVKAASPKMAEAGARVLEKLSAYPKLVDCAYFKVSADRLARAAWSHPPLSRIEPKELLQRIVAQLRDHGLQVYHAVNHRQTDAFCVVSCVSFELERFFLVSSGFPMAPGPRGRDLLSGKLRLRQHEPA